MESVYRELDGSPRPACAAYVLVMSGLSFVQQSRDAKLKLQMQSVLVSVLVDMTLNKVIV